MQLGMGLGSYIDVDKIKTEIRVGANKMLDEAVERAKAAGCPAERLLIDSFIDALWLEDGLARNSLAAYRRDLALFSRWLADNAARDLALARPSDLQGYVHFVARDSGAFLARTATDGGKIRA